MNAIAWISIAGLAVTCLGFLARGTWVLATGITEVRTTVKQLLSQGDRTEKRVDTIELRLNDHTERIARLEGRDE